MFNNIDEKINLMAHLLCWTGITCSVIFGVIIIFSLESIVIGILTIILGSLSSYICALILCGFGVLVKNSDTVSYNTSYLRNKNIPTSDNNPVTETKPSLATSKSARVHPINKTVDNHWICNKCSTKNDSYALYCKECGAYK